MREWCVFVCTRGRKGKNRQKEGEGKEKEQGMVREMERDGGMEGKKENNDCKNGV